MLQCGIKAASRTFRESTMLPPTRTLYFEDLSIA